MTKKIRKGISAPLGLIFGIIIAIVLVLLAVFIAFNITSTAVKEASKTLAIVGTPVVYYNASDNNITKLVFTIANPTDKDAKIQAVIVKGVNGTYNTSTIEAKSSVQVIVVFQNEEPKLTTDEINRGYVEFTVVTNVTTIYAVALVLPVG